MPLIADVIVQLADKTAVSKGLFRFLLVLHSRGVYLSIFIVFFIALNRNTDFAKPNSGDITSIHQTYPISSAMFHFCSFFNHIIIIIIIIIIK